MNSVCESTTKTEKKQLIDNLMLICINKNNEVLKITKDYGNDEYIECDKEIYNDILKNINDTKSLMYECIEKLEYSKLKQASENIMRRFELIEKLNKQEINRCEGYLDILYNVPNNMEHFLKLSDLKKEIEKEIEKNKLNDIYNRFEDNTSVFNYEIKMLKNTKNLSVYTDKINNKINNKININYTNPEKINYKDEEYNVVA